MLLHVGTLPGDYEGVSHHPTVKVADNWFLDQPDRSALEGWIADTLQVRNGLSWPPLLLAMTQEIYNSLRVSASMETPIHR